MELPLNLGILEGVPIAYLIKKQVISIKNNLTSKDDDDLKLYSSFRISNLKAEEEEEDFDADIFSHKLHNLIIPSEANHYFEMEAEKDSSEENSVNVTFSFFMKYQSHKNLVDYLIEAESNEILSYITQNGLKDWLPLDVMTVNELGSTIKITQNKLLAESHNNIDEADEVIDANSLYYRLKALSLLIEKDDLSTSDLHAEFQNVFEGLDLDIGLTDIIHEAHEQTNSINKHISSIMYLVKGADSVSNIGGLMRTKEKLIRIAIEQLKHLIGGRITNFIESFTFLTAVTLYNFYHTFKNIYDIWCQFRKCDELSKYLSEKKTYFKIYLDQVDYCIRKMLKSLKADDAKYEDYLKNFNDLNEKVENFIIEVKRTAVHCKKVIDELCAKKRKYDSVIGVGTSIIGVGLGVFGFQFLKGCLTRSQVIASLVSMGLSGLSLTVLAALSHNLGNKIKNFDKTLDLFKVLHEKLEREKNRRRVEEEDDFVENKQLLIVEYELLKVEFGAFETEL